MKIAAVITAFTCKHAMEPHSTLTPDQRPFRVLLGNSLFSAMMPAHGCTGPHCHSGTISPFAQKENAGAQVRILMAQLVAAFEVFRRYDVGLEKTVPLEVRQGFEEDS